MTLTMKIITDKHGFKLALDLHTPFKNFFLVSLLRSNGKTGVSPTRLSVRGPHDVLTSKPLRVRFPTSRLTADPLPQKLCTNISFYLRYSSGTIIPQIGQKSILFPES